jgi:hypothetical protein
VEPCSNLAATYQHSRTIKERPMNRTAAAVIVTLWLSQAIFFMIRFA